MSQTPNALKLFAAACLLAFGTAAFAGTDDGNVQGNVSQQTPANTSQQSR